ncbi:hypothetical protein [Saccharibacillus brassicae]|uniref:Uncharacterized protein n=1 Tax=Saccharibacillus brassicae TaxID=2583377 RepID=A0A4Y6UTG5_SACBS|nr:hypothetical protein [Saccharibacillus brassicae]QDH20364.1 hypothetical protein FFV09_05500 [Saccharibacillus brassicae]
MNKVNVELGATYYIPEGNEEKVLSSLEGMSLVEIEDYLVNQYLEIPSDDRLQEETIQDFNSFFENESENVITPTAHTETIRQIHPLPYNATLYLNSTVFSPTGAAGTFTYQNVRSYGVTYPPTFTGFYYKVEKIDHRIHPNRKAVGIDIKGHPENAKGIALAIVLRTQHIFNAG